MHVSVSQRPYSIRTRIKTWTRTRRAHVPCSVRDHIPLEQGLRRGGRGSENTPAPFVRDHIPLEQGLRPSWTGSCRACSGVRDHIPLEQGLRQSTRTLNQPPVTVRDHIPLEQGLRLLNALVVIKALSVRDHIPLEQGLRRLLMSSSVWVSPVCQRPYSIRTRIKTCVFSLSMPKASNVRDHIPLEQGLRPVCSRSQCQRRRMSETIFH